VEPFWFGGGHAQARQIIAEGLAEAMLAALVEAILVGRTSAEAMLAA